MKKETKKPRKHTHLSEAQAHILKVMIMWGPAMTVNEIAEYAYHARSTTSEIIKRMIRNKLLSKKRDDEDGCVFYVRLTKTGRKTYIRKQT